MKKVWMILIVGLTTVLSTTSGIASEIMGLDIHGFISQGYLSGSENDFTADTEDDSFVFSEMGLNFGKELNDNLRFGIQLFAKDFGDVSNNEIMIDWAYADYRFHEMLGVRFGQIKFPHGLYNEVRDIDMLRTSVFLPDSVYQEVSYDLYTNDIFLSLQGISSRDLYLSLKGIGLYGYIDLNLLGGLSYQALYGTQNIEPNKNITDRQVEYFKLQTPFIPLSSGLLDNDKVDVDFKYAGNLLWDTPIEGLRLGASFDNLNMTVSSRLVGDLNMEVNGETSPILLKDDVITIDYEKLENWVFSAEYAWDNLILTAEYLLSFKDYAIKSDAFERIDSDDVNASADSSGWYAGGAYRFTDWLELGGYYSQSRFDDPEVATEYSVYFYTEFDDICATARFDINEYWTIKLEAHNFRTVYPVYEFVSDLTNMTITSAEEEWYMYIAKMTVAF